MKVEWSDDALADLDRFASFLQQKHPFLAKLVANELMDKVQLLSDHPQLAFMEVVKPLLFRRLFPFEALSEGARWQAAQRRRLIGDEDDSHLGDFIEDKNAILPIDAAIQSNLRETYTFER